MLCACAIPPSTTSYLAALSNLPSLDHTDQQPLGAAKTATQYAYRVIFEGRSREAQHHETGAIISLTLVLAGCVAAPPKEILLVHKTGSQQAERILAHDKCKMASFTKIPQTQGVVTQGGYSNPGTVRCTTTFGVTTCNTIGAVNIPATASSYDVNKNLRDRFITRCLMEKGFSVIPLKKTCRSADERAAAMRDRDSQRPANQITCYDSTIPPL